nr:uncharacterized protein LOC110362007 [Columba livia]
MASQARGRIYSFPAMAAPMPAHMRPTSQGLLLPPQPAQRYPVTYHLGQGSVWQGVPGTLGQLLQLPPGVQLQQVPQVVQLSPGVQLCHGVQQVQLPQGVQLVQVPQGVQLPPGPAAFAPSYPWGQQLVMGTALAPTQPMGLGPWAVVQGQALYPTGSYQPPVPARPGAPTPCGPAARRVRIRPVPRTLPHTTEPVEASGRDGVAAELSVPAASPHQPVLAAPAETSSGEPTGECRGWQSLWARGQAEDSWHHPPWVALFALSAAVTTKAALGSPGDLPQQEPATCTRAAEELDLDAVADILSTWLDDTFAGDGVPEVVDNPDLDSFLCELPDLSGAENTSPGERVEAVALEDGEDTSHVPSTPTFLSEPPDLSEYVADGGCSKDGVVAVGLGDSKNTIPDVLPCPNSLRELDGFWEHVAESTCSQDQGLLTQLGDSGDASFTTHGPRMTAEVFEELPDLPKAEGACMEDPVTGEMLLCGDTTFPDGTDSLASSTPVTGDFWEYQATGDSLEHRLAAAVMGDTDPFWGVMASPSPAPQETQDSGGTDLPPWLQRDPLQSPEQSSPESPEESPEGSRLASPWRDPMTDSLESPLLSPLQEPLQRTLWSPLCSAPCRNPCTAPWAAPRLRPSLSRPPWTSSWRSCSAGSSGCCSPACPCHRAPSPARGCRDWELRGPGRPSAPHQGELLRAVTPLHATPSRRSGEEHDGDQEPPLATTTALAPAPPSAASPPPPGDPAGPKPGEEATALPGTMQSPRGTRIHNQDPPAWYHQHCDRHLYPFLLLTATAPASPPPAGTGVHRSSVPTWAEDAPS